MTTFRHVDMVTVEINEQLYNLETDYNEAYKLLQAATSIYVYDQLDASIVSMVLDYVDFEEIDEAIDMAKTRNLKPTQGDINALKYQATPTHKYSGRYGIKGVKVARKVLTVQTLAGIPSNISLARYASRTGLNTKLNTIDLPVYEVSKVLGLESGSDTPSKLATRYFVKHSDGAVDVNTSGLPQVCAASKYATPVLSGSVYIDGKKYQTGGGGLLSLRERRHIKSNGNNVIVEVDVSSMYPSILLMDGVIVDGIVNTSLIASVLSHRQASTGATAAAYKLVNNSLSGLLASKNSPLYAPRTRFNMIKTAQILMAELIEALGRVGNVFKANTDSVSLVFSQSNQHLYKKAITDWQQLYGLTLTEEFYTNVHMVKRNDYYCVKLDGSFKRRGTYAKRDISHDGMDDAQFREIYESNNSQFRTVSK